MKVIKYLLGAFGVCVLLVAALLGSILIRWPTMGQLKHALGRDLIGNQDIAIQLCHNKDAAGIVGASFLHDYKTNVPTSVPIADLEIQSPTKAEETGHGTAHVSGLAQSASYVGGENTLLPKTACAGTVAFDYKFWWEDNGVSSRWTCDISNVTVVSSTGP